MLDECSIDDDLAVLIADILQRNTTLLSMSLRQNNIGTDGTLAIASALRTNTTLLELDLTENCMGEQGGDAIASALQVNSSRHEVGFGSSTSALGPWCKREWIWKKTWNLLIAARKLCSQHVSLWKYV